MKSSKGSNRGFYLAIGLVAVAGIGALTYLSSRPNSAGVSQVDTTLAPVVSQGYVMGSATAPVEVIEFGDFECPVCSQFATLSEPDIRKNLVSTGKIRMRYIDNPLPMHKNTWNASRAAACADEQGKFWEMHDALFATQDQWNGETTSNPDKFFKGLAPQVGLNQSQFDQCVDSKKYQAKIQAHLKIGNEHHVEGTPTFVIGDKQVARALPYDEFKALVDSALAKAPAASSAAATPPAAKDTTAKKAGAKR